MTSILGLNVYHGDAAAALVVDGELVTATEEERFTRLKHVAGFPAHAAAWCLAEAGLEPRDIDHVAVGRDPRANLGAKVQQTLRRLRNPARNYSIPQRLREYQNRRGFDAWRGVFS